MAAFVLPFAQPQRVTGNPPPTGLGAGTSSLADLSLCLNTNPRAVFSNGGQTRYIVAVNTLQSGAAQSDPAAVRAYLHVLKSTAQGAAGTWNEVGTPNTKELQVTISGNSVASGVWTNYGIVQDGSNLIVARYTDDFASDGSGPFIVVLSVFDMNADDWGPDLSLDSDPNAPTLDFWAGDMTVNSQLYPQLHLVKRPSDGHYFLLWTNRENVNTDQSFTDLVIEAADAGIVDSGTDGVIDNNGVFSSATHTFAAGEIGAYVNIPTGGGLSTFRHFVIVGINAGNAILSPGPVTADRNTSGLTWQLNGANIISSASYQFTQADVFVTRFHITGGVGFNTGWSGATAGLVVGVTDTPTPGSAIVVATPYVSSTFPPPVGAPGTLGATGGSFTISQADFTAGNYTRAMLSEFNGTTWNAAVNVFGPTGDAVWYAAGGLAVGDASRIHAMGWKQARSFDGTGNEDSPASQLVRTYKSNNTFGSAQVEEFYNFGIQSTTSAPNGPSAIPFTRSISGTTEIIWPYLFIWFFGAGRYSPNQPGALKVLRFTSADVPVLNSEIVLVGSDAAPANGAYQSLFWNNESCSNWPGAADVCRGTPYLLTIGAGPNLVPTDRYLNLFTDNSPWDASVKLFQRPAGGIAPLGAIAGAGSYPGFIGIALTNLPQGQFAYDDIFYFEIDLPPTVSGTPPGGTTGTSYAFTFNSCGAAALGNTTPVFSVFLGSLPPGLSLDSSGNVSGKPTLAGVYPFTVKVTDVNGLTALLETSITITGSIFVPLSIICNDPRGGFFTVTYSHAFLASGGTPPYTLYEISTGALPNGLTLDGATGIVTGTPTVAGLFEFSVRVTDSVDDQATVGCSILVSGCPPNAQGIV